MTDTTSVADAVSPTITNPDLTVPSAAPAEKVQSAEQQQSSPQAEKPAGTEQEQVEKPGEQKPEPTADEKRRERNKERWQAMKQDRDNSLRREQFYLGEIERLKKGQPDLSTLTDPDEVIAAKTANILRKGQTEDNEARVTAERAAREVQDTQIWATIRDEMVARAPDFDKLVQSVPISKQVAEFILDSEKGGDVALYLGQNPDKAQELDRLAKTAPRLAERELGRIEARLSAPAPKLVSTAPKPAPVLNGGVSPLGFDPHKSSVSDMAAELKKAGIIRRG